MQDNPRVIRTKNFVADAAAFILEQARRAMAERNKFRIALSGGNTPAPIYRRIATEAHDFPWDSVRFTFGDERCVPPDDPQSNFRMARENLFVPAGVPTKSILRMRGEIDPQIAAQEYEDQLNAIAIESGERIYQHDNLRIGLDVSYREFSGLSNEVVERLERARPRTFGEARKLPGLTPAALSTLLVHLSSVARTV